MLARQGYGGVRILSCGNISSGRIACAQTTRSAGRCCTVLELSHVDTGVLSSAEMERDPSESLNLGPAHLVQDGGITIEVSFETMGYML